MMTFDPVEDRDVYSASDQLDEADFYGQAFELDARAHFTRRLLAGGGGRTTALKTKTVGPCPSRRQHAKRRGDESPAAAPSHLEGHDYPTAAEAGLF